MLLLAAVVSLALLAEAVVLQQLGDSGLVGVMSSLEVVEWLELGILVSADPAVDEVGKRLLHVVAHVGASGHSEYIVKFFKGSLLGLRDPQEDHDESDNVGRRIETEDTLFSDKLVGEKKGKGS